MGGGRFLLGVLTERYGRVRLVSPGKVPGMSTGNIDTTKLDRLVARLVARQTRRDKIGQATRLLLRLWGVDWRPAAVGPGLRMPHSTVGSVVHSKVILGANVTVMHGVTIGRSDIWTAPGENEGVTIEDDVLIGANAVILFRGGQRITIAAGSIIGAGAVVTRSTGPGEVWVGNPAHAR